MAPYFREKPPDKSDSGMAMRQTKKSGLNFTPHARPANSLAAGAVKRAKVPRGPPPTAIQGVTKESERGRSEMSSH